MKYLITVACLLLAGYAMADEAAIDVGVTRFSQAGNGTWYQNGFTHDLSLVSPSVSLKYYTAKSASGWQIGGGYDYIGKAGSSALAVPVDSNYSEHSANHCNGACLPLSHWYGEGEVDSLFVAVRKNFGHWFIEPELYASRPTWTENIPDWRNCTITPYGSPINVTVTHAHKIMYDPALAAGYRWSEWSLILKVVPTHANGDGVPAIYKGYSPTLAVEYFFD